MERQNTKKHIMYTALAEFLVHGYTNSSLNSIVEKAGITKGGFYHYFPSKEALFSEVVDTFFFGALENNDSLAESLEKPLEEAVKEIFLTAAEMWIQMADLTGGQVKKGMYNLVFQGVDLFPELEKKFIHVYEKYLEATTLLFQTAKAEGKVKSDVEPETAAYQLLSLVEGMLLLYSFGLGNAKEVKKRLKESAECFLSGIVER